MVKILGIDPGYDRMGMALIEHTGSKDVLIDSVCLLTNRSDSHSKRLKKIADGLIDFIKIHQPDHISLEKLYFSKNQKTALAVAEARGVILYIAENMGINIHEYNPSDIKIAVTGYGRAGKKEVIDMVKKIIQLKKDIKYDDEFDAISAAITCGAIQRF